MEGESESMTDVVSEQGPGNRVISWGISTLSPGKSPGLYAGCCGRPLQSLLWKVLGAAM